MTGKTHRVGGMLCCLAGYSVLQNKGMLISNVNPLLQLTIMYPFALYGSTVSDMDHNWESAPSKDIFSYGIHKVLHLTSNIRKKKEEKKTLSKSKFKFFIKLFDARHRSWQTHSDLFLIAVLLASMWLPNLMQGTVDGVILSLVATGLLMGILSHLVLDLLTPEGLWSFIKSFIVMVLNNVFGKTKKLKFKLKHVRVVPNSVVFATSSDESTWEKSIRKLMWVLCFVLVFRLIYIYSPYRIDFVPGRF